MRPASPSRRRPSAAIVGALVLAAIVAGCGSALPSATSQASPSVASSGAPPAGPWASGPSASPGRPTPTPPSTVPGVSWSKAAAVDRPEVIVSAPMPSSYHHPGHFEGQAYMAGVARTPDGFVAVGYEWPGWHALSWRSPDGATWRLTDLGEGDGTFMNAVAAGPSGTIVGVGRDNDSAAAWATSDGGATWTRASSPSFTGPAHLRANAVAAVPGGFLAGGASGPDIGRQSAVLWSSPDGRAWSTVPLPDAEDARVTGIATSGGVIVAVGTRGTERAPEGSIAWTSGDGRTWHRVPPTSDLADGLMVAVAADGPGFVAVGTDAEQYAAVVWRSADGERWERVASPTFAYHDQKVRMTAVAAGPAGLVAVGNYLFGTQYGFARVWTSPSGAEDWSIAPEVPSFGQGEMLGVAADATRVVAVGTFGAPDNYVPTVWVSPPLGP